MKRFWQSLIGWPLLFLLLIAALWCVTEIVAESRFDPPPPGKTHRLNVGEESSRCLVLRIPIGWEPQEVQPSAPDSMTTVFLRSAVSYPYIYVKAEVFEDTQPSDWVRQHANAQRIPLLAETTHSDWAFDSERQVRWRTITQHSPSQVEIELFRRNVYCLLRVFRVTGGGEEFHQTIRNIVDQLRIEKTSNTEKTSNKTESATIQPANAKFAMGNGTERTTARKTRMTVFIWSLAILVVLIVVHLWLNVIDVNSRIRNTTRLMTAIRQGTPLGRAWNGSETEDNSSNLSP